MALHRLDRRRTGQHGRHRVGADHVGWRYDAVADGDTPTPFVAGLFGLAIIRFVFGFTYRFGLFRSALRIEKDLRNLMYERLTELSFDFWDRTQSGQVISRANTDIRSIQLLFAFGPLVAMQVVLFFFAVAVMLTVDITLTLVAMRPAVRLCHRRPVTEPRVPLQWVVTARQAEMATIVDENIQGIEWSRRSIRNPPRSRTSLGPPVASAGPAPPSPTPARHAPGMESPRLGLALVLLYGGLQTIDGELAIGDLVAFSTYVVLLATPFRLLGFILIQWQRAGAAAIRVFDILDETPSIVEPNDAVALPDPAGRIEFDDVHFGYPVGEGEPVLAGSPPRSNRESPSPSSAPLKRQVHDRRLIPRFYDVDSAGARRRPRCPHARTRRPSSVCGHRHRRPLPVRGLGPRQCRLRPPRCLRRGGPGRLADAAASDFVSDLEHGPHTEVGERGLTLSGGQRQRLAIARTLLTDPQILILDDATSAIDVAVEERIHAALDARRADRTTILIAHRLSTIALADRVILLDNGAVAATGTHDELLTTNPRYAAILADTVGADTEQGDA